MMKYLTKYAYVFEFVIFFLVIATFLGLRGAIGFIIIIILSVLLGIVFLFLKSVIGRDLKL